MNRRWFGLLLWIPLMGLAGWALGRSAPRVQQTDSIRHLIILYTNDEHGWMDSFEGAGGAAGMMDLWKRREGYDPNDPRFLVLSGGDMWTGPALSTGLKGESMTDVMGAMGYRAAAIGNHDFDFGVENIHARGEQAAFPFLSANIREAATGAVPGFARPYAMLEVNGVKVGVIGMTTPEARIDTLPESVAGLEFIPPKGALREVAPQARDEGGQLLLIISHLCSAETHDLAGTAAEFDIPLIGGGHCHEEHNEVEDGVHLIESGYFLRGYVRVDLAFDTSTNEVISLQSEIVHNDRPGRDGAIAARVEGWRASLDPALSEPIGYAAEVIDRKSPQMAALTVGSWLRAFPEADVALASPRYMQQNIYPGPVTEGTVLSVLASDNRLLKVRLTGAQLIEVIESRHPLMAGVAPSEDGYRMADGSLVDPQATYLALIPHMLYPGGNYYVFYRYDPNPVDTGVSWRAPVVNWLLSIASDEAHPLNDYLNP